MLIIDKIKEIAIHIKNFVIFIRNILTPVDYNIKPVSARSNSYYAKPEQLISLEDLCLTIKYDCAEILSNAIRTNAITLLYHHKMAETSNGKRMVIYVFPYFLEYTGEVILCRHRLYFDKQEVALYLKLLPLSKELINMFEVPPERTATKDNVQIIMKKVIRWINVPRTLVKPTCSFGDIMQLITTLFIAFPMMFFLRLYAILTTYDKPYHCSKIEGYSSYLPVNYTFEEALKLYEEKFKKIDYRKYNLREKQFKELVAFYFDIFNLTNHEIGKILYSTPSKNLPRETLETYGYRDVKKGRALYEENKGILNILKNC